ncbi:MAG: helix-turn-helix domain-containing protein [Phycisphaerales bacterium]
MTSARAGSPTFISTPDEWQAVTSAARMELLEALISLGESTAAELGFALDRAPDGLYHHLRALVAAGLVEQGERHEPGRRPEATFAVTGDDLRFDVDPATGKNVEPMVKVGQVQLRRAARYFADAMRSGDAEGDGPNRNLRLWVDLVWLNDAERERANELFGELHDLFESSRKRRHGTLHACTFAMSPVVRTRGTDERTAKRLSRRSTR